MRQSGNPSTGSMASRRRVLAGVFAVVAALTWATGSVSATIIERSRTSEPYDYVNWDCGYPMDVVGVISHSIQVRADKKFADIVFVTDRFAFKETWTAADGRWFTIAGNNLFKDLKAKSIGDGVYQFTFSIVGQPVTITNSSGKVVARDRGRVSFEYTINFADGSFEFLGVTVKGPHPTFDADTCKIVQPLTGSNSPRYLTPRPIGSTSFPLSFYEYLPPSYTASGAKSPVLLAFNGYGENSDGTPDSLPLLLNTGIPRFINVGGWPTDRPLVVLAMQHVQEPPGFDGSACEDVEWFGSCNMQLQHDRNNVQPAFCTTPDEVHDFVAYAVGHYNVDPTRVYVTGLSCGGFGVWEYLAKYGDAQVAAAIPIAADGRPAWSAVGCGLAEVPVWAFHGELDDVINPLGSIETMANIAACPGVPANEARLTTYPDLYHDGWDQAYSGSRGEDIYSWMLGFSNP